VTIVAIDVILLCILIATSPLWVDWVGDRIEEGAAELRRLVSRGRRP
jgi:hypothetical protein